MGYNAQPRNVLHPLSALERHLPTHGYNVTAGAGVAAAEAIYSASGVETAV
jgi:aspartate aminotransferase-like enzyme